MALYPHNQKTYDNIVQAFTNGVRDLIIVQGTGVGKSFLTMELIEQYFHDKRILYICPKECIEINIKKYPEFAAINQRVDFKYNAAFNNTDLPDECLKKYDVFVIDECHHLGSAKQGANIKKIIGYCKTHTDKYVIGLTATPIREEDKNGKKIDVSTYFSSRINGLSVFEAIEEGLMPSIEYLVCKPSRNLTEEEKQEYRQEFDIENSEELLRKIIEKNNKNSYLIFYSSIKEMNETTEFIQKLIPGCRILNISSDDNQSQALLDTVKKGERVIIQSVNMLLEGLHLPLMDCVILFRNTQSLVILQQIIGRVSSIGSKINPLIIDCTEAATKTLFKILHEQEIGIDGKFKSNNNNGGNKRKRRPILKISAANSEFFDLSLLFTDYKFRSFNYEGKAYNSLPHALSILAPEIDVNSAYSHKTRNNLSNQEILDYYTKPGYDKYYCIPFKDKWYHAKKDCCDEYNVSYDNVINRSLAKNISFQDSMEYFLEKIKKDKFPFNGKLYNSARQCCIAVDVSYDSMIRRVKKINCVEQEAIQYLIDCKDQCSNKFPFNGKLYNNAKECCIMLDVSYSSMQYRVKKFNCTKQEAIQYLLDH